MHRRVAAVTSIDDIIQPGQPIPDDVTGWRDKDGDEMSRMPEGWWCCNMDAPHTCTQHTDAEVLAFAPLTVTAVREQPAEPVSGLCVVAADGVSCSVVAEEHRRIYHGGLPPAEPQQADVSPLLDLVRQYGGAEAEAMSCARGSAAWQRANAESDMVFARIAALVPQQPVQACNFEGTPMWQHACTAVSAYPQRPQSGRECSFCPNLDGDWRPLLVAAPDGDRTPEVLPTDAELDIQIGEVTRERDEARAGWKRSCALLDEVAGLLGVPETGDLLSAVTERLALSSRLADMASLRERERDEARAAVQSLKAELARVNMLLIEATPQPDPMVLRLPEVPEGTVALTGVESGRRYVLGVVNSWRDEVTAQVMPLYRVLERERTVRVELAPPREPRTWPKLDDAPQDLIHVRGASGTLYTRWTTNGVSEWRCDRAVRGTSFGELLELDGPLTEVLDREAGW